MKTTILIKTFERKDCLIRLLSSIKNKKESFEVHVADDSKNSYKKEVTSIFPNIVDRYVDLDFDSGISKGRNELLSKVKTKHFVLCDDDFIFDGRTDVEWMKKALENKGIELLGGLFFEPRGILKQMLLHAPVFTVQNGIAKYLRETGLWAFREEVRRHHGKFEIKDEKLYMNQIGKINNTLHECDYTHNFFIADTSAVRKKVGGWDDELKVKEHWDFFLRAKQAGLKVASTERVGVTHLPFSLESQESSAEYSKHRKREKKYNKIALEKNDLGDGPIVKK